MVGTSNFGVETSLKEKQNSRTSPERIIYSTNYLYMGVNHQEEGELLMMQGIVDYCVESGLGDVGFDVVI